MKTTSRTLAFGVLFAVACTTAFCADDAKKSKFFSLIDMSVPRSAAQSLLGIDPSKLDSPTKLTDLGLGLLRGNGTGQVGDGFSLSMSLDQIVGRKSIDWREWVGNTTSFRISHFTQLSGALVAGSADSPGRAAFGVALPLIDDTDWRTDSQFRGQYAAAYEETLELLNRQSPDSPPAWNDSWTVNGYADKLTAWRNERIAEWVQNLVNTSEDATEAHKQEVLVAKDQYLESIDVLIGELNGLKQAGQGSTTLAFPEPQGSPRRKAFVTRNALVTDDGKAADQPDLFDLNDLQVKIDGLYSYKIKEISEQFEKQASAFAWNRRKFDIAAGSSWGSADNTYSNLAPTGVKAWLCLAMPLGSKPAFKYEKKAANFKEPTLSSLTLYSSLVQNSREFKDGAFLERKDGYEVGLRYKSGGKSQTWFLEGLSSATREDGSTTSKVSWTLGIEKQLQKTQWLQFSLGSDTKNAKGIVFGLGYSLNLSQERELEIGS